MDVAIPLYPNFTALDAVGPYEVLSRLPGWRVRFLALQAGPVTTETGMLTMVAEAALDDVPAPEVVLVPGGIGARDVLDGPYVEWVRAAHATSRVTASVCSGSFLLGAAGVLQGLEATTYWSVLSMLEAFGATPVQRRWVRQGKVWTAAGVSAGLDMALALAEELSDRETAEAVQLGIEYDPAPPFNAGSAVGAPEARRQLAVELVL